METTARLERSRAYQQIWKERLTVTGVMVGLAVLFVFSLVTIIVRAESGTGARPMDEAWVRSICDAGVSENIPFFYKQDADKGRKKSLSELDGKRWAEFPRS